jgi:hypothetical protein
MSNRLPPSLRPERRKGEPFPPPGPRKDWTSEQRVTYIARMFTCFAMRQGDSPEVIRLDVHRSFEESCDLGSTAVGTITAETEDGPELAGNAAYIFQLVMADEFPIAPSTRERFSRVVDDAITAELRDPSPSS